MIFMTHTSHVYVYYIHVLIFADYSQGLHLMAELQAFPCSFISTGEWLLASKIRCVH